MKPDALLPFPPRLAGGGSRPDGRRLKLSGGFLLVEVAVAMLLLVILLVPLSEAALALSARASRLDDRSSAITEDGGDTEAVGMWSWGARTGRVSWGPGPELHVDTRGLGTGDAVALGVWVDGWFEGETELESDREVTIGSARWRECEGAEVVVRARGDGGPWGAPWRTLVPDETGEPSQASEPSGSGGSGSVAVHLPGAGSLSLVLTSGGQDRTLSADAGPATAFDVGYGPTHVGWSEWEQSYREEGVRALDVYF